MKKTIAAISMACLAVATASAQDFFSTDQCDSFFNLGVRVGINTSNRTLNSDAIPGYNHQGWGTGFDAGVVADINIRDYLSIQPGVFFESRSGHSSFVTEGGDPSTELVYLTQEAHRRTYNLAIPVLASVRFNVTENLRWMVEAGPYVSFVLSSKFKNKSLVATDPSAAALMFSQKPASTDFGFKLGTGLQFFDHYYVGVHYLAGATKAYKDQKIADGVKFTYGGLSLIHI